MCVCCISVQTLSRCRKTDVTSSKHTVTVNSMKMNNKRTHEGTTISHTQANQSVLYVRCLFTGQHQSNTHADTTISHTQVNQVSYVRCLFTDEGVPLSALVMLRRGVPFTPFGTFWLGMLISEPLVLDTGLCVCVCMCIYILTHTHKYNVNIYTCACACMYV